MYNWVRAYYLRAATVCAVGINPPHVNAYKIESGWASDNGSGAPGLTPQTISFINSAISNPDMRTRVTRMLMAVEHCIVYESWHMAPRLQDDRTLRVFIVPEFYFRQPNGAGAPGGAYSKDEADELYVFWGQYFNNYSAYHPGAQNLRNWLFLCGTCIRSVGVVGWGTPRIRNDMFAFFVGGSQDVRESRVIRKMYTSHIDGIPKEMDFNKLGRVRRNVVYGRNNQDIADHYFAGLHVFVEICLEHSRGLMRNYAMNNRNVSVSFHVISAGGMGIVNPNTLPMSKILRNDGFLSAQPNSMTQFVLRPDASFTNNVSLVPSIVIQLPLWNDYQTAANEEILDLQFTPAGVPVFTQLPPGTLPFWPTVYAALEN